MEVGPFFWGGAWGESGWGGGGCFIEFEWDREGGGVGWALIRGWALINFFCLWDGRLFEVCANLSMGANSNKYGIPKH